MDKLLRLAGHGRTVTQCIIEYYVRNASVAQMMQSAEWNKIGKKCSGSPFNAEIRRLTQRFVYRFSFCLNHNGSSTAISSAVAFLVQTWTPSESHRARAQKQRLTIQICSDRNVGKSSRFIEQSYFLREMPWLKKQMWSINRSYFLYSFFKTYLCSIFLTL